MKQKTLFIAAMALLLVFLTACQPTPATPPVIHKTDDFQTNAAQDEPEYEPYDAPDSFQHSFSVGSSLSVVIDAHIEAPDTKAFGLFEAEPLAFSQAQAEQIVNVLLGDAPKEVSSQIWTKAMYEEVLIKFKAQHASGEEEGVPIDSSMSEQAQYEANIKDLEERIRNAPQSVEAEDVPAHINAFGETGRIYLVAEQGKENSSSLRIVNADDDYESYVYYNNNNGKRYSYATGERSMQEYAAEDAVETATALVSDLTQDMHVAGVGIGLVYGSEGEDTTNCPRCYFVYFTRTAGDIPTTFDYRAGNSSNEDVYDKTWPYERITVGVDETGIVQFEWCGQAAIRELTGHAQLLTFEDLPIESSFKALYSYSENEDVIIDINRITLGFTRIKQKNKGYCLVPAWDFFGSRTVTQSGETRIEQNPLYSFLTINALDGSLIDRDVGY